MFGAFDLSLKSSVVGIIVVLMQMLKSIRCENFLLTQSLGGGGHMWRGRGGSLWVENNVCEVCVRRSSCDQ